MQAAPMEAGCSVPMYYLFSLSLSLPFLLACWVTFVCGGLDSVSPIPAMGTQNAHV